MRSAIVAGRIAWVQTITFAIVFPVSICCNCVSAAEKYQERFWNEIVRTTIGEQFIVKRWERRRLVHVPGNQPGWLFDEARITAVLPHGGRLEWETSVSPWLLDQTRDGTWYLVGKTFTRKGTLEYGLFHPRGLEKEFIAYRLTDGAWQRITGSNFPSELEKPNLLAYSNAVFEQKADGWMIFDGATHRRVSAGPPISNGALVDLDRKGLINFPTHFDSKRFFTLAPELFDDGIRYLPCQPRRQDCDWEVLKLGFDARFGRSPVQR